MQTTLAILRNSIIVAFLIITSSISLAGNEIDKLLKKGDSLKYIQPSKAYELGQSIVNDKASTVSQKATAYRLMGVSKYIQSNYRESMDLHLKALELDEMARDSVGIADDYNNIAIALDMAGKDSAAIDYYHKSIELRLKTGDDRKLMRCYNNIGTAYLDLVNEKLGIEYLNKASAIASRLGDRITQGSIDHNIGMIYLGKTDHKNARDLFLRSEKAHIESSNSQGLSINYLYLARTELESGSKAKYRDYINRTLKISKQKGFLDVESECYASLGDFHEAEGNLDSALYYIKLYYTARNNILNEQSDKAIAEMQTKYESEKKDQVNALLTKENALASFQLQAERNRRNFLLVSIGLLAVLALFIYNRIRTRQKTQLLLEKQQRIKEVLLASENEKARLSRDLHDGLGPLLSLIKLNVSSIENDSTSSRILHEVKGLASEGLKEVRRISHALLPTTLDRIGLKNTLKDFLEKATAGNNLQVHFEYDVDQKLTADLEMNLYRIIQEAINNTIKHAHASEVNINIKQEGKSLLVLIKDNGQGFNRDDHKSGNGSSNILSRVEHLNGSLKYDSLPGQGTSITLIIPVNSRAYEKA